jgi:hypothetical protein
MGCGEALAMISKQEIVKTLTLGSWVAEEEIDFIKTYFVETDVWEQLHKDKCDIVLGTKGSGKSALYLLLKGHNPNTDVITVEGSNVNGDPVFTKLVDYRDAADEMGLVNFWRIYLLSLAVQTLLDRDPSDSKIQAAARALDEAGLTEFKAGVGEKQISWIMSWLKKLPNVRMTVLGQKVRLGLDPPDRPRTDLKEVDASRLFALLDDYLKSKSKYVWILVDRLDAAFVAPNSGDLERKALRALFRVYASLRAYPTLRLKLFMRSDIWDTIMAEPDDAGSDNPFREAARLNARLETLKWDEASLINLLSKRATLNKPLVDFFKLRPAKVVENIQLQRNFLNDMLPKGQSIDWVLKRVVDGSNNYSPRELLHFFACLIKHQRAWFAKKHPEIPGQQLFIKDSMDKAMSDVSRDRLKLTLYAEYPHLRACIQALEHKKAEHTTEGLMKLWKYQTEEEARTMAEQLEAVGFFGHQRTSEYPYIVPMLYRPALHIQPGRQA